MTWSTTVVKPAIPGQDFDPTTIVVWISPATTSDRSEDLWDWATRSNLRPGLFSTFLTSSSSQSVSSPTTTRAKTTISPTLTAPVEPSKSSFPIGIPIGVSLGVFVLAGAILFWLGKKGKLGKLGKNYNPYWRNMKKEEQKKRVEMVEADRRARGVELVDGKEVPIQSAATMSGAK